LGEILFENVLSTPLGVSGKILLLQKSSLFVKKLNLKFFWGNVTFLLEKKMFFGDTYRLFVFTDIF